MEINAKVYAAADDLKLLEQVHKALTGKTFQRWFLPEEMEPCAVLPLTKTWYGFTERAEPTDGPEGWLGSLRECAQLLRKNGAVVVEFRSPDAPDDYLEYAYTTSSGNAGSGTRAALFAYDRAVGNRDVSLAIDELFSERTARDRERICWRRERREAIRREKGDFEITADSVLKRYRGRDTEVVIPDGVREIGSSSFVNLKGVEKMLVEDEEYDAPEMETLVIPDGVEKIGDYAFAYCMNLKSVTIADSVKTIGDRAFEGCEFLKEVRLPEELEEIEEFTFFLCENLKSIAIPDSVRKIGQHAFDSCSLSRITLPEGLVSIGDQAFSWCSLRKVRIPESVTEIGKDAFPKDTQIIRKGEGKNTADGDEESREEAYEADLPDEDETDDWDDWNDWDDPDEDDEL